MKWTPSRAPLIRGVALAVLLTITACSESVTPHLEAATATPISQPMKTSPSSVTPALVARGVLPVAPWIAASMRDLAHRASIDTSTMRVASAISVVWSTSALGCPDAQRLYSQVLTPGYLLTLVANGQNYTYHTDQQEDVVLCGINGRTAA